MINLTKAEDDNTHKIAYYYGTPVIAAIIILANALVIVSALKITKTKKDEDKATYVFMANLALSDAIMGFLVGAGALIYVYPTSTITCYIHLNLILSATMASLLFIVLMSLDRYVYIVHGLHYCLIITPYRAKVISVIGWIYSLLIGFVPISVWKTDYVGECVFVLIASKECILIMVVLGILLPITTVFISYAIILYHTIRFIRRKAARLKKNLIGVKYMNSPAIVEDNQDRGLLGLSSQSWRAFGACVVIVGAFMVTWMPYFTAALMYSFCTDQCEPLSNTLSTTLAMLGLMNSLLNPVIYTWWQRGFWAYLKERCSSMKTRQKKTKAGLVAVSGGSTQSTSASSERA